MTCKCKKRRTAALCEHAEHTRVPWGLNEACYVTRCSNPNVLTDPPEWAATVRLATVGDTLSGEVIEGAGYVAVRSCFCREAKCPHFVARGDD